MPLQLISPLGILEPVLSEPQRPRRNSDMWLLDPTTMAADAGDSSAPWESKDGAPPVEQWSPAAPDLLRYHSLTDDPEPSHIWRYTPVNERRLFADVQSVADLDTFVGRILLVVARGGDSKNFEEMTGQDGLTFGITDFAGNEGCADFFRSFYEN